MHTHKYTILYVFIYILVDFSWILRSLNLLCISLCSLKPESRPTDWREKYSVCQSRTIKPWGWHHTPIGERSTRRRGKRSERWFRNSNPRLGLVSDNNVHLCSSYVIPLFPCQLVSFHSRVGLRPNVANVAWNDEDAVSCFTSHVKDSL